MSRIHYHVSVEKHSPRSCLLHGGPESNVKTPLTFSRAAFLPLFLAIFVASCFNSNQPTLGAGVLGSLQLEEIAWGRLVNVQDVDGVLVESDVIINPDLDTDGQFYDMEVNPVSQAQTLIVQRSSGTADFNILLGAAKAGIEVVEPKAGIDPPPYSVIPRNAAIRLRFSDPVDASTVTASSIQVLTGDPASLPQSVRYVVQNDNAADKGYVIIDPIISAYQSATLGLPTNPTGFPESSDSQNDNLLIRIPPERDLLFGQAEVLSNEKGTLTFSVDVDEPQDVAADGSPVSIRVLRTGNPNDPYNGFLRDVVRPTLVAIQDIGISAITAPNGSANPVRELTYSLSAEWCANLTPKIGDVIELQNSLLSVQAINSYTPIIVEAYTLDGFLDPALATPVGAKLSTRYDQRDAALQICYVDISPTPTWNGAAAPLSVDPGATFEVTFSEPIDPLTVMSMHSLVLTAFEEDAATFGDELLYFRHANLGSESASAYIDRQRGYHLDVDLNGTVASSERGGRVVFGAIQPGAGSRSFTLVPTAGLFEPNTDAFLQFSLAVRDGSDGIRDLAGSPLDFSGFVAGSPAFADADAQFTTTPVAGESIKYFSLRALSVDENNDGLSEYGGQLFYDQTGAISGRSADSFSRDADPSNEYVGAQLSVTAGVPYEPLTPAGSVAMTMFRVHDLGFGYLNPAEYNLDVVGMAWSPLGGSVFDDQFDHISLALGHSAFLPDEALNIQGLPVYPNSGLNIAGGFDDNILGFTQKDPQGQPLFDESIVYDGSYTLREINRINAESGNTMLPWPEFSQSYTWRDTNIPDTITGGHPQDLGAPPTYWLANNNLTDPIWAPTKAPSIAMPLLARFRTYPRSTGNEFGSNTFQVTQMVASSQLPAFRVFSAGGLDSAGDWHFVIPDDPDTGGTMPVGGYAAGQKTSAFDTFVYWSEIDFVVRVSRVFTHWFDMSVALPTGGAIGVLLEPENSNQPTGTYVTVELRGAEQVAHGGDPTQQPSPLTDAATDFNDFAEYSAAGNGDVSSPSEWTTNFADLEAQNYRYFQVRLTFVNNTTQGTEPSMDGLGIAWKWSTL